MAKTSFAADLRKFAELARENAATVVKAVAIGTLDDVVERSPVGQPKLWAANANAALTSTAGDRAVYNVTVDEYNSTLGPDERRMRKLGKKRMKTGFKVKAPAGYVGGRFRANNVLSVAAPTDAADAAPDASGTATRAAALAVMAGFKPGPTIYIQNNLPYAKRIEEGHSGQAPAGVYGLAFESMEGRVRNAVAGLRKK